MNYMFSDCNSLTTLDLSSFDTSKVTNMSYMFDSCSSLTTLDLSNFDTSNVTAMMGMFRHCSKLTTIKGIIDMKSCIDCGRIKNDSSDNRMFKDCPKLKNVKIKNPPEDFDGAGLSSSQYTIVS
jgi:surface protein